MLGFDVKLISRHFLYFFSALILLSPMLLFPIVMREKLSPMSPELFLLRFLPLEKMNFNQEG